MPVASYWPLPLVVGRGAAGPRAPLLSADDFLVGIQNLLPPGKAWSRSSDSLMTQVLRTWAVGQARAHARQVNLLSDAFPATAYELLPEWEASEGLPDPCAGLSPTDTQRRNQVLARLKNQGGQTIATFVAFAAELGVTITIDELSNWRVGENGVEDFLDSEFAGKPGTEWETGVSGVENVLVDWAGGSPPNDWDFVLKIIVTQPFDFEWAVGDSSCEDPLTDFTDDAIATYTDWAVAESTCEDSIAEWGSAVLECELGRILPGPAVPIFAYAPAS